MVIQAVIYRTSDALPLSGSTDTEPRPEIRICQRYIKTLSKRLSQLPDRCVLHLSGYNIFFITALDLSFLVLCEASYPSVLAFCFLGEIQKEFLLNYDRPRIQAAKRPYTFIEYDTFLQKTKQRYKNTRGLTTKLNLNDMSTELKLRPPFEISESDVQERAYSSDIVMSRTDTYRPTVGPGRRLVPLNWLGALAIIGNLLCMLLNLTRGMAIISHGHFDEEDDMAYRYGFSFLLAAGISLYQIRLLFYVCRWRKGQTFLCLVVLCGCCYFLQHFRNWTQISFHVTSAVYTSVVILTRKLTEKLPGYSV